MRIRQIGPSDPLFDAWAQVFMTVGHQQWGKHTSAYPADELRAAVQQADAAMQAVDRVELARTTPASRALSQLKHLVENDVALALDVTIGFSDADGD